MAEFQSKAHEFKCKSEITVRQVASVGGDSMVVAAAKVSTTGEEAASHVNRNPEASKGLINYLMKHRHGTPFEHSALTFFVHAPIFVWREWHRHRIGFSYNEESGRYKQLEPTFYLPPRDRPMMQVEGWKPGRPKFIKLEDETLYQTFCARKRLQYEASYESYEWSLRNGFDPGLARIDLSVGIYSSCWVTCNPRSLMAFLSLRTHHPEAMFVSYPLYEIEVAAEQVEEVFKQGWPMTYQAFIDNGRVGP